MSHRNQSGNISRIVNRLYALMLPVLLLAVWSLVSAIEAAPAYLLPSPWAVAGAFLKDLPLLGRHLTTSLEEAGNGLAASIAAAFALAILMDNFRSLHMTFYPMLVVTQTIPVIAIAPLLVLWLGYGILPKIVLIFIVCFFPMVIALLSGFAAVDQDMLRLFRSMNATRWQVLTYVKIPSALPSFFSGLRIAASYAVVGAVIAEWLGGDSGLGVYMTRVRKSYAFDKMFAVILLISIISLLLIWLVDKLEKKATPWNN